MLLGVSHFMCSIEIWHLRGISVFQILIFIAVLGLRWWRLPGFGLFDWILLLLAQVVRAGYQLDVVILVNIEGGCCMLLIRWVVSSMSLVRVYSRFDFITLLEILEVFILKSLWNLFTYLISGNKVMLSSLLCLIFTWYLIWL